MKTIVYSFLISTVATSAFAAEQSELSLSKKCEEKIIAAVVKKLGKDDDTFSVVGVKLLYGGSKGGLHFSPVALVRTSDEVEPRDVIVITEISGDQAAATIGCQVRQVVTVADGLVLDVPELEM